MRSRSAVGRQSSSRRGSASCDRTSGGSGEDGSGELTRQCRLIHNTSKHVNEGFFGRSENIRAIDRRHSLEKSFEIGSVIGKGNFSTVRYAVRRKDEMKCALKEVDKRSLRGKWFFVENEVEVLAGSQHSNICLLIDAFQTDSFYYLFFEYAQDGDVFEVVRRKGRLEEREAQRVIQQTASALSYLHSNSIAHRDVKPENLLLFGNWKVKLCDFGLACTVLGPLSRVCGTPTYCAPEVVSQSGYGTAVDVWSLGVVLHVLLVGQAPFRSTDRNGLFKLITRGQLKLFQYPWTTISSNAKHLLRKMLTVDADIRLTANDVLEHPWIDT
ncbi:hypothetical protein PRIPAC_94815 [Pristionchus pacificus]|uniref:Protein kinase domain-containing protein n=1 Tax=Pristionchus pacificus TaxID=54126 RepID=A0A2A6BBG6_PRIPA|nr:hypothetical protein PRIPAC_94815 [Pristionchus pacificus]|eukprot:PDM63225.1 protein kinase [Pristionchus pacificus]